MEFPIERFCRYVKAERIGYSGILDGVANGSGEIVGVDKRAAASFVSDFLLGRRCRVLQLREKRRKPLPFTFDRPWDILYGLYGVQI